MYRLRLRMEITVSTNTNILNTAVRDHIAVFACYFWALRTTHPADIFCKGDTHLSSSKTTASVEVGGTTLRNDAIGLPGVLFQAITAMAPAAATATALSPAILFAGASLPLAVVLATVACAMIASCIGQLAIHIPSAGGMYTYISRSLGAKWGFLSAWVFLIAQPLLLPLVALIWGVYTESLIQTLTGIDIPWWIFTILGIIVVFALTYYGIRLSTRAGMVLGTIEISIILALSITMIVAVGTHNDFAVFTPIYSVDKEFGGLTGIFQGMVFAFLAFVGFETAAPLGEETHNPKRNIPRAVIYSAIAIGLLYTFASFAGVNGWGIPAIQGYAASTAPWADLGKKYWGVVGPVILSFAIINSALGNGNAGINATSRVAYDMGRKGTLPRAFARLSSHRTPSVAIIVHSVASIVISISLGLIYGYAGAYGLIGTILTLGLLILYVASCVSTFFFYLRERRQDFRVFTHVIVPAIPVIILFFVFYSQVYPVPPYPFNLALPVLLVWIVLGIVYLFYLNRTNPTGLERGKDVFYQDLEAEPENLRDALEHNA
jgi:amino acid transporter